MSNHDSNSDDGDNIDLNSPIDDTLLDDGEESKDTGGHMDVDSIDNNHVQLKRPGEPLAAESKCIKLENTENTILTSGDSGNAASTTNSIEGTQANDDSGLSMKMRGYQKEISEKILRGENDIIILPTGAGKTLIASNLILHHLNTRTEDQVTKVLFLAPRRVLVEQQIEAIKQHLGEKWNGQCTSFTSDTFSSIRILGEALTSPTYMVIASTPQLIVNYFDAFESSTMKNFSLIIFDECHNAKGKEPYSVLLDQYMDERLADSPPCLAASLPQLVGLTATIGIGKPKTEDQAQSYMLSFCSRFFLKDQPTEVIEYKEELNDIVEIPLAAIGDVASERKDPFSEEIKRIMKEIIDDVKIKMKSSPVLKHIESKFKFSQRDLLESSFSQKTRDAESALGLFHELVEDVARQCIASIHHLQVYHKALQWANLARVEDANDYLREEMKRKDLQTCECYKWYRDMWGSKLTELSTSEAIYPNEKLQLLRDELDKILECNSERVDDNFQSKVIIFVEDRKLTKMIRDWLHSLGEKYRNSERYVSSLRSSDQDGMSPSEAGDIMERFRSGELNILVSTSILSEGVDVPECNGVIRYMYIKDAIAEVQVPGRVRVKGGKVIGIFNDKLKKQYKENKIKEAWMKGELKKIREISAKEFTTKMESLQTKAHKQRVREKEMASKQMESLKSTGEADVACRKCGRHLGNSSSTYCYMSQHHIVLDGSLAERVKVTQHKPADCIYKYDGFFETADLVCRGTNVEGGNNCGMIVGSVRTIKVADEKKHLGSWNLNKVSFKLSDKKQPPVRDTEWKKVKRCVFIDTIHQEKLEEEIEKGNYIQQIHVDQ